MSDGSGTKVAVTPELVLKITLLAAFSSAVGFLAAYRAGLGTTSGVMIGSAIFGVGLVAILRLGSVPREMWFTFCLKLFSVTAYKLLNVTLVLWLMDAHGFSNSAALFLITGWGLFMSSATVLSGSITDVLGLRRTLLFGATICVVCRLVMIYAGNRWLAVGAGLLPLAIGEALCTPVLVAAVRRYSTPSQRSIAFSLFYAIMNLSFMLAYFLKDALDRSVLLVLFETKAHTYLLLTSAALEALIIPFALFFRRGVEVSEKGVKIIHGPSPYANGAYGKTMVQTIRETWRDTSNLFAQLFTYPGFGKLVVFLLVIGLLKIVFNIMDYVLPPFARLEVGQEMVSRIGRFNAINSILILVLAPIVAILTQKRSAYSMVIVGGFITAASFTFLVLPPATFQSWANGPLGDWIGRTYMGLTGAVHPYYVMIALWQVVFSIGEAFYSPRVYEYAASIAPKGQEASYSSLSYIPMLIGKAVTGVSFAFLLDKFCPKTGPRDPGTMWLIIALLVLVAPVTLLVLQRFIRVKEVGRED